MPEEYAVIVITPDAVRDGLTERILGELADVVPMQFLWRRSWRVPDVATVFSMYRGLNGRPSCAPIIRTMTLGECIVLVVRGHNVCARLNNVKGTFWFNVDYTDARVGGIRYKYRTWTPDDLERLRSPHHRQEALEKIFEYRLHTTDNLEQAAGLCALCMSEEEVEHLKTIARPLYDEIIRRRENN